MSGQSIFVPSTKALAFKARSRRSQGRGGDRHAAGNNNGVRLIDSHILGAHECAWNVSVNLRKASENMAETCLKPFQRPKTNHKPISNSFPQRVKCLIKCLKPAERPRSDCLLFQMVGFNDYNAWRNAWNLFSVPRQILYKFRAVLLQAEAFLALFHGV